MNPKSEDRKLRIRCDELLKIGIGQTWCRRWMRILIRGLRIGFAKSRKSPSRRWRYEEHQ